jgi:hypothetical protein
MTDIEKYGKFLSNLNNSWNIGRVISTNSKLEFKEFKKIEDKIETKKAENKESFLSSTISTLKKIISGEPSIVKDDFNNAITDAMKSSHIVSKQYKTSIYTTTIRKSIISTIANNYYTGVIIHGELFEFVQLSKRKITEYLEPPKEIFDITPKLGKYEDESYNHMIDLVKSKKEIFFSKKSGVGYCIGYSKDILADISKCEYFAIITTENSIVEFVKKNTRRIHDAMPKPYFIK